MEPTRPTAETGSRKLGRPREQPLQDAVHLLVLWGFAVAQPVFAILSQDATFFVARRSSPAEIVGLALGMTLGPPALLAALEWLAGRIGPRVRRGLHGLIVAVLVSLVVLPLLEKALDLPAAADLSIALAVGAAGALAATRLGPARLFLTVLAPAPLVFAAFFLLDPSLSHLLRPRTTPVHSYAGVASDAPVVMVVLDELPVTSLMTPGLEIDGALFPAFARLAAEGTWLRNATTNDTHTKGALLAMLTGRIQREPGAVAVAPRFPENLFTWLAGSHRLVVREWITHLCPDELAADSGENLGARGGGVSGLVSDVSLLWAHRVLPGELTAGLPGVTGGWGGFAAEVEDPAERVRREGRSPHLQVERFEEFIAALEGDTPPTLYFLHVVLPHAPWMWLPSGRGYPPLLPIPGLANETWGRGRAPTELGLQQHLLQVGYIDALLGRLLDRMDETGLWERAVVVVVGDHGAAFWPGLSRRDVTGDNVRDLLHVPLLIKVPGGEGARVLDHNVETIDLLPTLADVLGSPLPWEVEGCSALDPSAPRRPRKTIMGSKGEAHEVDGELPETWPALQRKQEFFGELDSWSDLYAAGRGADLVGRSLDELAVDEVLGASAALHEPWRFEDVDSASPMLPCLVSGALLSEEPLVRKRRVAVAVDGVVRGIGSTFERTDEGARFAVLLPEAAFRDGPNRIELLSLGPRKTLQRIPTEVYGLRAGRRGGPAEVVRSDGSPLPLRERALAGEINNAWVADGVLKVVGWAADREADRRAEAVLFFLEGRERAFVARPATYREDLQGANPGKRWVVTSGFRLQIPLDLLGDAPDGRVRAFAVLDGEVTPLPFEKAASWLAADSADVQR